MCRMITLLVMSRPCGNRRPIFNPGLLGSTDLLQKLTQIIRISKWSFYLNFNDFNNGYYLD